MSCTCENKMCVYETGYAVPFKRSSVRVKWARVRPPISRRSCVHSTPSSKSRPSNKRRQRHCATAFAACLVNDQVFGTGNHNSRRTRPDHVIRDMSWINSINSPQVFITFSNLSTRVTFGRFCIAYLHIERVLVFIVERVQKNCYGLEEYVSGVGTPGSCCLDITIKKGRCLLIT